MKFLDRFLRDWCIKMTKPYAIVNDKVLDIGCFDATLFEKLSAKPIANSLGLDPLLKTIIETEDYTLLPKKFPEDLPKEKSFNCLMMLAVLEHIRKEEQGQLSDDISNYLEPQERVIIKVPSPFVDYIYGYYLS